MPAVPAAALALPAPPPVAFKLTFSELACVSVTFSVVLLLPPLPARLVSDVPPLPACAFMLSDKLPVVLPGMASLDNVESAP